MPASSILLLDADATSADAIGSVLTGVGYTVTTVADAEAAMADETAYQLIIVDVVSAPKTAADLCRTIRATPTMAGIPILSVSQTDDVEERIAFLEAGADDVMAKPFDSRELEARVEALLLRFQRSRDMTPVLSADGLVVARARRAVAVFSPKGGVGTTTIATNIAVAKARGLPDRVMLIDLALQFGGVASHLNLDPKTTLADAVRDETAMREPEILRTFAMRHESGLHVLAAPGTPEGAQLIEPAHVERVIKSMLEVYDYVVIDAGSQVDERSMTALEAAESVVLPVCAEIAALRAVHGLIDYFNDVGSLGLKATLVLNNMYAKEGLKLRDIESALETKITIDLPYDPFVYLKAVNEGNPVVLSAPKTPAAERLTKLSATVFGDDAFVVPMLVEEKKKAGRFGLRRG